VKEGHKIEMELLWQNRKCHGGIRHVVIEFIAIGIHIIPRRTRNNWND
jgi:hypothetical protein